jgi:glycosyl transferase family 25
MTSARQDIPISRVYIVHSKHHEATRGAHIRAQVQALGFPAYFIMEGEADELSKEYLEQQFDDSISSKPKLASCCHKHLLAAKYAIENKDEVILVLENDVFFEENWASVLAQAFKELKEMKAHGYLLSLEDTTLKYVPRSKRRAGQVVYANTITRMAGAYILDLEACRNIVKYNSENKVRLGPDWNLNFVQEAGLLNIYWMEPSIVEQGSHNGKMQTSFFTKGGRGIRGRWRWLFMKFYKKHILYNLR